jgi:CBS domain-containing protein
MSTKVVAVTPSAHFREVAELMLDHGIGAVPVIDDVGGLLAIISDADLIAKLAYGGGSPREGQATCRSRGRLARELMTAPVETALADDVLHSVARRMVERGLRHLVVVDECRRMVGIVSRRDLVRVFARPDHEIAAGVRSELTASAYADDGVKVSVGDGVVTLDGWVPHPGDAPGIRRLAWLVPGVVDVVDRLAVAEEHG